MANLVRDMERRDSLFNKLFGIDMGKPMSARERVSGNRQMGDVTWLTGGDTPVILAWARWATQEFPRVRPDDVVSMSALAILCAVLFLNST